MNTTHESRGRVSSESTPHFAMPARVLKALEGALANVSNRSMPRWALRVAGLGGVVLVLLLATMAAMPVGVRRMESRGEWATWSGKVPEPAGSTSPASPERTSSPAVVAGFTGSGEGKADFDTRSGPSPLGDGRAAEEFKRTAAAVVRSDRASTLLGSNATQPLLMDRAVIRKATIEIKAAEVAVIFAKVSALLSEASGEYIEQSSFSGQGATAQATLKLRVVATRLSTVLKDIRGLGEVTSESSGGEDVTEQAVDLDARLANERRVEKEMLGLLDSRANAPLNEVLALRDQISRVRETIEKMEGAQSRLSRLVSLATVLVVIRADTAAPVVAEVAPGLGERFTQGLNRAWTSAVVQLSESAAWMVFVLVAGMPWGIGAFIVLMAGRVIFKRVMASSGPAIAPVSLDAVGATSKGA